MLAPIVLFVYNRPIHTQKTLYALSQNDLASESDLYIYSDAAKNINEEHNVSEVRKLIKSIKGFKSVTIIEAEKNLGLASSIIQGVTHICDRYGKIIVLEDDLVVSLKFLTFMNAALDKYALEKKIWHISGWNYPIDYQGLPHVFCWRAMNCWGWATWSDRWCYYTKKPNELFEKYHNNHLWIQYFNLDGGYDFWSQVVDNIKGRRNTWAIFWFATIIEKNGLCLNPSKTYVSNIGLDGSGENCKPSNMYDAALNMDMPESWNVDIIENKEALNRIISFYKFNQITIIKKIIIKLNMVLLKLKGFINVF